MFVAPHPHIGLQTVTWLLAGEVEHKDGLGSKVRVRPGDLSLMTAGHGIAHSEYSIAQGSPTLFGIQFWVALPEEARHQAPSFEFIARPEEIDDVHVFIGEFAGRRSQATVHSPMVGAQLSIGGQDKEWELDPEFEYGVIAAAGDIVVNDVTVESGSMYYLITGHDRLRISGGDDAIAVLIGGVPFEEPLVMWWNFVGRTHEEIVEARAEWEAENPRFATVIGDTNDRIPAPPMPNLRLKPRSNA